VGELPHTDWHYRTYRLDAGRTFPQLQNASGHGPKTESSHPAGMGREPDIPEQSVHLAFGLMRTLEAAQLVFSQQQLCLGSPTGLL